MPISLSNLKNQHRFTTSSEIDTSLISSTGKSLHDLVAEAIAVERNKMLSTGDSREYIKLLQMVFGKFAVSAPTYNITENDNPLERMSKEELEDYRNNLMTRLALSTKTNENNE